MPQDTWEEMDRGECETLLRPYHLGHLGVTDAGRPLNLPVNDVFDNGSVVFRT